jgi:hypothetical protein
VKKAEALLRFHPASFSSAKSKWVSMSEPSKKSIGKLRMALYGLVNLPTSIVGLPIALYIPAFYLQSLVDGRYHTYSLTFVAVLIRNSMPSSSLR